jgi:hypothetical protein
MKINPVVYKKLLAQAEEAKSQGFTKLADGIINAIGSYPNDEKEEYSYNQLQDDIHRDLWKIATRLMYYYDMQSLDALKLDQTLVTWASAMLDDLEVTLNVDNVVAGVTEPKTPGEH